MNSNVHPLVVVLVLMLTGLAIVTWMWGSGEAASIGGPGELKMDPGGHAFVQIQNALVEHDENGQYLKTHDFDDIGAESFLGSFGFFSNGDILLRRGPDPRSTGDNVRAFMRLTNEHSIEPESSDAGLFRCDLLTDQCARFGETGVDFKAAHGIFVDWKTNEVYISDTTRHVLRKYSSDGVELAGPVSGFKFPNQLLIHNEQLFVADTNNHEIRTVDPSTDSFGEELDRNNVTPEVATNSGQRWPSHFIRVADEWWVNNMRTDMDYGGIYVFDNNWRLNRKLDLPDGADPIALLAIGDEVWISDWYNDKVRRFSKSGEPLTDLESPGLDTILARARDDRRYFDMISYSGVALIVLILSGLGVRAFAVGMSKDEVRKVSHTRGSENLPPEPVLSMEPDPKILSRMRLAARLIALMMIVLAALIGYIVVIYEKPDMGVEFILPGIGMFSLVLMIGWVSRSNAGTAIRVDGGLVTLRDYTGRESSCPIREVRYDATAIATQDAVVFLGRPPASIYKRSDLDDKLFPRLADAHKASALEMQKILIQQQHPQGVMSVLALIGLLIYAVWTFAR
jgi:hypothetical protein